jgi:large repetitive protein
MQHGMTTTAGWRFLPVLAGSLALSLACGDGAAQPECEEGSIDPRCEETGGPDAAGEKIPQCMDGIDNDGDGHIDYPNDPGCTHPHDDSEADDCPDGPLCPECSDGIDNDGDGLIDWPMDPGCTSAADPSELGSDCGNSVRLRQLPEGREAIGHVLQTEESALVSDECGGAGAETVYLLTVTEPSALRLRTSNLQTSFDTVLYVRSTCTEFDTELACAAGRELFLDRVDPGEYYLVVDALEADRSGTFKLEVDLFTPSGDACDAATPNCPPGLVCRLNNGVGLPAATETTCELPQCSDGVDNDGDGQIDFPNDPGCSSPEDNNESTCEFGNPGPGCTECGNGVDDDGDGLIDFPADPGCEFAADVSELDCNGNPDVAMITATPFTGSTTGKPHDTTPASCSSQTVSAADAAHFIAFPGELATLSITGNAAGTTFSHALYVRSTTCGSADIGCQTGFSTSPASLTLTDVAAGGYFVIVDGTFSTANGGYSFNVSAVVKTGQACDPGQVAAGIASCQGGGACTGGVCQ